MIESRFYRVEADAQAAKVVRIEDGKALVLFRDDAEFSAVTRPETCNEFEMACDHLHFDEGRAA